MKTLDPTFIGCSSYFVACRWSHRLSFFLLALLFYLFYCDIVPLQRSSAIVIIFNMDPSFGLAIFLQVTYYGTEGVHYIFV